MSTYLFTDTDGRQYQREHNDDTMKVYTCGVSAHGGVNPVVGGQRISTDPHIQNHKNGKAGESG